MLICFDAATKIYNSISEETKTAEVHQGKFETMTENFYVKKSIPWPVNTILIASDSMMNGIDEQALKEKFEFES